MKKKYTILIIIIILFVTTFIGFKSLKQNNVYEKENKNKPTRITKGISMNLEQTAGAGDYKTVTQSTWPTDEYVFNEELSRCENGSELSWDDANKKVIVSGNLSDKCYVYFDIYVQRRFDETCNNNTLACYTAKKFTGTQGDNGMYYHDSSLANGAGDNSYRYVGANPNNFVCFGSDASTCPDDNLYRIIGVIDGKVKLIKYDYANSNLLGTDGDYSTSTYSKSNISTYKGKLTSVNKYYWNKSNTNTWSESLLNKTNLNINFINNIGSAWANKIATTTWKVGGNKMVPITDAVPSIAYKNEIINPAENTTYNAKIGLIYVSDYGFAAAPSAWITKLSSYNSSTATSANWMYMGAYEWTISRNSGFSNFVFRIYADGLMCDYGVTDGLAVRPSFNLTSSTSYVSGSGSMTDPIRIN